MNLKKSTLLIGVSLIVASMQGCAVNKQLTPTGGSRADGTVKLSYEYEPFEIPKLDKSQGLSLAKERCSAWGYSGAEPFGGSTKSCNEYSSMGCSRWLVTIEYQCTGNPPTSK